VPAASSGEVVYSGDNKNGGFGKAVIIESTGADGAVYYTLYGHLNGVAMPALGQTVMAGDTIGEVGSTGNSTGSHLHFELLDGDTPVNPAGSGPLNFVASNPAYVLNPNTFTDWNGGAPYGSAQPDQTVDTGPQDAIGQTPDSSGSETAGAILGDNLLAFTDSPIFSPEGIQVGEICTYSDGTIATYSYVFDGSGNIIGDAWAASSGYSGADTRGPGGNSSGVTYNASGSLVSVYTNVAQVLGNISQNSIDYNAAGQITTSSADVSDSNGNGISQTLLTNNWGTNGALISYVQQTTLASGVVTTQAETINASQSVVTDTGIDTVISSYNESGVLLASETVGDVGGADAGVSSTTYYSYAYNSDGSITTTYGQTTNSIGTYSNSTDNGVNTITNTYGAGGQLQSTATDGDLGGSNSGYSSTTTYAYNANGTISSTANLTTNTDGSSSSTTDNGTDTVTNSYSATGQLETTTNQGDPGGADAGKSSVTDYAFNSDGSSYVAFSSSDNGIDKVETAYNAPGQVSFTQTTGDAGGADSGYHVFYQYDYYPDGALSSVVNEKSAADGEPATQTDVSYTEAGVPIISTVVTYFSDSNKWASATTDSYDGQGNIIAEEGTQYGTDGFTALESYSANFMYDGDGNLISSTSTDSNVSAETNVVETQYYGADPYSEAQTYSSDLATSGELLSDVITAGGGTSMTNYSYDSTGNLAEVNTANTAPDGSTASADTQYSNNANGGQNVTTKVNIADQSGNTTGTITSSQTFDASGNLTASTQTASGVALSSGSVGGGTYSGGGYAFAGGTTQSAGVNIGVIAQYDLADGDTSAALAAIDANQEAVVAESGYPSESGESALEGPKWSSPVITWSLASSAGSSGAPFSSTISSSYLSTIEAAFSTWSAATGITFEQVSNPSSADIQLGWGSFAAQSTGVLGYTSYTEQAGKFSSASILLEDPSDDALVARADGTLTYSGTNTTLQQLLLHEIGHALGLADDSNPGSIMYTSLGSGNTSLSYPDIAAVQALYGGGSVTLPTTTIDQDNASGQLVSSFTQNSDGSSVETTYNATGRASSAEVTNADGSTSDMVYQYNADGSYTQSTVSTPASGGASSTSVTDFTAQGLPVSEQTTKADGSTVAAAWVYNADGSYTFTLIEPSTGGSGNTTLIDEVNASGQVTNAQTLNPDGSSQTTDYNAAAQVASTETVAANGATDLQSWSYNGTSISSETEVNTPTPGGPSTTTVTDYNAQGQTVSQQTTNLDGSSDAASWVYQADGSYTLTLVETPSGGAESTDLIDQVSATGQVTSLEIDNPNASAVAAPESQKWTYSSDGSFTVTDTWANADSSEPITQVTAYSASDQVVSENNYSPSSNGSYTDSWSQADGSHGTYWWNSSTGEYLDTWNNADGRSFTDEYQYSPGGGPTVAGSSYTETYSASDGDTGTRQYTASTNTTMVTWDSSATGLITSTSSGDTGFVGLINNEELTNAQNDPTYFNPAANPAFSNLLATHG
jgi:hypothetical protein